VSKKSQPAVRLSQDEIKALCEQAVGNYIEKHELVKKEHQSRLLYNTKVLLENYRKLKRYIERATANLEDVIAYNYPDYSLQVLEILGLRVEDQKSYTIAKGVAMTKILMNHVERMLHEYQTECENSGNPVMQRRWDVISKMYLEDQKMDTKRLAEKYCVDPRVIQADAKQGREDIKILLFGIEALVNDMDFQSVY
jgi:hypothetical protein